MRGREGCELLAREGGGKLASKGGDRTLELVSSSSPPPGAGGEWHRPVGISSPSCFEGKIFGQVSTVTKWRWGGKEEERLIGCLRMLRGLCNVQMCKLCSMMMIFGPTAPSIIVQRCIQPRSRKDERFLKNLITLARVLAFLMSISIKLTRNNENMCACLCTVFRPCFDLHKKGFHIRAPKTLEFSCV